MGLSSRQSKHLYRPWVNGRHGGYDGVVDERRELPETIPSTYGSETQLQSAVDRYTEGRPDDCVQYTYSTNDG
jgi:hypothetical protein